MTPKDLTALLRAHAFTSARDVLSQIPPSDIADLLERVTPEDRLQCFRLLPKELAAAVFVEMGSARQEELISAFNDAELRAVVAELFVDDTVDIIEEMPAGVVRRILAAADPATRREINELLRYPRGSVGSVMTTEYVTLHREMRVGEALAKIRATGTDRETIYTLYVTSERRRLLGTVSARQLLLSSEDASVGDLMRTHPVFATTDESSEDAARKIRDYDLLALPVTDRENRMVGIVTVDDALDVLSEESEEDFAVMAAITPARGQDEGYLQTGVFRLFASRIPWLLLLMVSAAFTGMIITRFEARLAVFPVLTAFIPMLMDSGGNSGSQASVTVIRALSLGDITPRDAARVLFKECRVALLCGAVLAAVNFAKMMLLDRLLLRNAAVTLPVAAVVCLTLALTVFAAKAIGCTLPLLAKKIGADPAVMASPFITTIVDALSLLLYFAIASAILPGFGG